MIRKPFVRNVRLRILPNLTIEVRVGLTVTQNEIESALDKSSKWIDETVKSMRSQLQAFAYSFSEGETFLYLGHELPLQFWQESQVDVVEKKLMCPISIQQNPVLLRQAIRDFYKKEAEAIIFLRAYKIAKDMGIEPTKIKLKFLRSRWGSCSLDGVVTLNYKLVACPIDVLDYVIVHEYAHLIHMNHSKDFWSVVSKHCANWKSMRQWLRQNALKVDFLEKHSQLYS